MNGSEVFLFQLDRHQDVRSCGQSEQEVRSSHRRREPECAQPTDVKWMPHPLVRPRRHEAERLVLLAPRKQPDLPKAKEIEMVDQERRDQNQQPAEDVHPHQQPATDRILYRPNHTSHWLPLPEHEEQGQTGEQNVRAPLGGLGNNLRPPLLETRPGHYRVLNRKQREQQSIHQECLSDGSARRRVDGDRHQEISNPSERIVEGDEANNVADRAIEQDAHTLGDAGSLFKTGSRAAGFRDALHVRC